MNGTVKVGYKQNISEKGARPLRGGSETNKDTVCKDMWQVRRSGLRESRRHIGEESEACLVLIEELS